MTIKCEKCNSENVVCYDLYNKINVICEDCDHKFEYKGDLLKIDYNTQWLMELKPLTIHEKFLSLVKLEIHIKPDLIWNENSRNEKGEQYYINIGKDEEYKNIELIFGKPAEELNYDELVKRFVEMSKNGNN